MTTQEIYDALIRATSFYYPIKDLKEAVEGALSLVAASADVKRELEATQAAVANAKDQAQQIHQMLGDAQSNYQSAMKAIEADLQAKRADAHDKFVKEQQTITARLHQAEVQLQEVHSKHKSNVEYMKSEIQQLTEKKAALEAEIQALKAKFL